MSEHSRGTSEPAAGPLAGIRVVEATVGLSTVGAGMVGSLPGALLRDLGAEVVRVQSKENFSLDEGVEYARSWDRGKHIVEVERDDVARTASELATDADVLFVAGHEEWVERRGLAYRSLAPRDPRLVVARIRPSRHAGGSLPDVELLVQARMGVLTQLRGHRPGPVFCDLALANAGAGLCAAVGALATLFEREATGVGGWVETSLYDGALTIMRRVIARAEHPTQSIRSFWEQLGPDVGLSYRCADGEWLQLWFGAKGAYEAFLEHIGDPESEAGYTADMQNGAMTERGKWWAEKFATRDRAWWMETLKGREFRCEPVLRPGEALRDPHVREIGLGIDVDDPGRGPITVLGPVGRIRPVGLPLDNSGGTTGARLLSGVRVLDLAAYLAGPVTPQVLAELGADVIKVEPAAGDRHRAMDPSFAAAHRSKRVVALDLKSPDATAVLHRLFEWADVVHHNSRIGLAERLAYDEATVRTVNPDVIYCHASGFGAHGPRAPLAANDHLMQALSGLEAAGGGDLGPMFVGWSAIDVTGGWVAACSLIAALYAKRRTGAAQSVVTSLLGAGMTLKSGAFLAGDTLVEGPVIDDRQTGYGAAYRIYEGADAAWFAVAALDVDAWTRLRTTVGVEALPDQPPPLRARRDERQPAEKLLEEAFVTQPAATWVAALDAAGVPVEAVADPDRATFNATILDDTVNRQLGRVVTYDWGPRGRIDHIAFPMRLGPEPRPAPVPFLARIGQHTDSVLAQLGFDDESRAELFANGTVAGDRAP